MPNSSPFEIVTTNKTPKSGGKGVIIALVVILILGVSIALGVMLVNQNQNISERANEDIIPTATPLPICGTNLACSGSVVTGATKCKQPDPSTTVIYCCGAGKLIVNGVCSNATPTPTASPTPSPSPTPLGGGLQCNASCTSSSQCQSGSVCYISSGTTGFCRNTICVSDTDCICPAGSGSPSPSPTPSPTLIGQATNSPTPRSTATATATAISQVQTSPLPIPETGTSLPTILGAIFGIFVVVGSLILAF